MKYTDPHKYIAVRARDFEVMMQRQRESDAKASSATRQTLGAGPGTSGQLRTPPPKRTPPPTQVTPPQRPSTSRVTDKGRAPRVYAQQYTTESRAARVRRANAEEAEGSQTDLATAQRALHETLQTQDALTAQAKLSKTKTKAMEKFRRDHDEELARKLRAYEDKLDQAETRRAAQVVELEEELEEAKRGESDKPIRQIEVMMQRDRDFEVMMQRQRESDAKASSATRQTLGAGPGTSGQLRTPPPKRTPPPTQVTPPQRPSTSRVTDKGRAPRVYAQQYPTESRAARVRRANAEEAEGSQTDLATAQRALHETLQTQDALTAQAKLSKTKTKAMEKFRRDHDEELARKLRAYEDKLDQAETRRAAQVVELEEELEEAKRGESDKPIRQIEEQLEQMRNIDAVMFPTIEEMAQKTQAKARKQHRPSPSQGDGDGDE